jgi:hypothetical protein
VGQPATARTQASHHLTRPKDRRQRNSPWHYAIPDQDPSLPGELPYLTSQLHEAPADLAAGLPDALDIQVLYRPQQHQPTIRATLTDPPRHHHRPANRPPHRNYPDHTPARQPRPRLGRRPYLPPELSTIMAGLHRPARVGLT